MQFLCNQHFWFGGNQCITKNKQKLRFSTVHIQKIQIRYQTITYTYYYHYTSINYYLEISLIYTEPINCSTESNQIAYFACL